MTTTKTTFKPEDFSPIHLSPEKPTKEGWYVSTWGDLVSVHDGRTPIPDSADSLYLWYWNGKNWCTDDSSKTYSHTPDQDRDWFGLKEEFIE